MKNTNADTKPEQLYGIDMIDVPRLLEPWEIYKRDEAARLATAVLVRWDDKQERWERTRFGDELVDCIRSNHRITLGEDGGVPRWFLADKPLNCGASIEVLRRDGTWLSARFEVSWYKEGADAHGAGGRSPVLYVGGFPTLVATLEPEDLKLGIFRWPPRESSRW